MEDSGRIRCDLHFRLQKVQFVKFLAFSFYLFNFFQIINLNGILIRGKIYLLEINF